MFGKLKFRVITKKHKDAAANISKLLREDGIKIYDLKESKIVSNKPKQTEVYILCCEGTKSGFEKFKDEHELMVIVHEGFRTLV
jgi:hypothetical protein